MPCGRTVIIWAVCDKCQRCVERMEATGSVRGAIALAREYGWKVGKDETVICDECQQKKEKTGD